MDIKSDPRNYNPERKWLNPGLPTASAVRSPEASFQFTGRYARAQARAHGAGAQQTGVPRAPIRSRAD